MRIIIAGSRNMNQDLARCAIWDCYQDIVVDGHTEGHIILSGCYGNVDREGIHFAEQNNYPCRKYPADWDKHGKAAGPIRNREMAAGADVLILIWDGTSKGSANMREEAITAGLDIYETVIQERFWNRGTLAAVNRKPTKNDD